jgi:hypothetical protein
MEAEDPLAALVVDETLLAREELAAVLGPFVRFTASGGLLLEKAFDHLTTLQRVGCVLLAMRAAELLGLRDRPGARPREIVAVSGMPPGTVRPKLGALVRERIAVKEADEYMIPGHGIRRAVDLIKGATGE